MIPTTFRRNEQGQAVVEFAIVVPLIAMLLFAILQFGIVFNNYLTLTDAVRAGARKATVSRHATSRHQIVETAVKNAAPGLDTAKLDISLLTSWEPGTDVKVSASYPYSVDVLGMVVSSGEITSTTTERVE
jgi:Flp pilus assembly protein TadG